MEAPDPKLELIAREVKRLREEHDQDVSKFRDWVMRLDAEMERLWHELGLRRVRGHRTTDRRD